jgi:hypothetical protein
MTRRSLTKSPRAAKAASAAPDIAHVSAVIDGLKEIASSLHGIAQERTKQREIKRASEKELAQIGAMRDVLLDYLARSFDERQRNFESLFNRVDQAMATGDPAMLSATLGAVVALAQSSPFEALRDVASTRKMLSGVKKIEI